MTLLPPLPLSSKLSSAFSWLPQYQGTSNIKARAHLLNMKSIFSLLKKKKKKNHNLSCITQDKSQSPSTGLRNLISPTHIYGLISHGAFLLQTHLPLHSTPTSHVLCFQEDFALMLFAWNILPKNLPKISAQMVPFQRDPPWISYMEMQPLLLSPHPALLFFLAPVTITVTLYINTL